MVYVAQDGSLQHGPRPWGLRRLTDTFWAIVGTVELFFQGLFPFFSSSGSSRAINFRSSSGTTSSRRNNTPHRRTGGIRTMSDIAPPPPAFGGCSGGSCGL